MINTRRFTNQSKLRCKSFCKEIYLKFLSIVFEDVTTIFYWIRIINFTHFSFIIPIDFPKVRGIPQEGIITRLKKKFKPFWISVVAHVFTNIWNVENYFPKARIIKITRGMFGLKKSIVNKVFFRCARFRSFFQSETDKQNGILFCTNVATVWTTKNKKSQ